MAGMSPLITKFDFKAFFALFFFLILKKKYNGIISKTTLPGQEICAPQMLNVQEAILGNIWLLHPILTLALGLCCWSPLGRGGSMRNHRSLIPVLYLHQWERGRVNLSTLCWSISAVIPSTCHSVQPFGGDTLPISFTTDLQTSGLAQPVRKPPGHTLLTCPQSLETSTSPRGWGKGTPRFCSATKQSCLLSTLPHSTIGFFWLFWRSLHA